MEDIMAGSVWLKIIEEEARRERTATPETKVLLDDIARLEQELADARKVANEYRRILWNNGLRGGNKLP